jgi:esterase/lipase
MTNNDSRSHPEPRIEYNTAVDKIQAMQAKEEATPGFNPELKSILLTHGEKIKKAVLWFHGYTSATKQFKALAELCHQQGYNAFVPCVPHHGMKDRMTSEVSWIKAEELVRFSGAMIDLAHGLGEEVVVGGMSMGGVMTAWAAQERADVEMALVIAPFLGARIIPTGLIKVAAYAIGMFPDRMQWWDPEKKEDLDGPDYGYPQRSTRSLSQILKLGFRVVKSAHTNPPAAKKVRVMINEHDESVDNEMICKLVKAWEKNGAEDLQSVYLPDEAGIPHDCISIEQPKGNTELVYGELMRLIEEG